MGERSERMEARRQERDRRVARLFDRSIRAVLTDEEAEAFKRRIRRDRDASLEPRHRPRP